MMKRITVSALAAGLVLALAPVAAAHAEEVHLSFDTRATSARAAEGTVAGQFAGTLSTRVVARRITGNRARVTADWAVEAGARSFTARLRGVMNVRTRAGVLTGRVTSGYLLGAEARVRGRLLGKNRRRFVGTLTLVAPTPVHSGGGGSDTLIDCAEPSCAVESGAGEEVDPRAEPRQAEEPVLEIPAAPAPEDER